MMAISPAAQTADVIVSMLRFIDSTPSRATANAIESNVKQLSYEKVLGEGDSIALCDPVSTLRQPAKIAKYKWGKIFSLWPTIAIKKIVFSSRSSVLVNLCF
jgi:hypothetical protein